MTELTLNTLTQRLDRLERGNRRLKLAVAVLLISLAAVGVMGQVSPKAAPKVIEAERFVLRDTSGKPRATLVVAADGTSGLSLYDQNGKGRLRLYVDTSGPSLALADQNGKLRATLRLDADGSPGLTLFDRGEKLRGGLGLHTDGSPLLGLLDQSGKLRATLGVATSGPSLVLHDENQKYRAVLGHAALKTTAAGTVEQRPESSLMLLDKDGKVIWKAP